MKYFIEIGSNNYDTCIHLAESGSWIGVVIEPITEIFYTIKRVSNCYYENLAITENGEDCDFFYYPQITGWGTLNKNHIDKLTDLNKNSLIKKKIKTTTANKIFEKYKFPQIDLLKIDAESYDGKIIKTINFKNHQINKLIFEYIHLENEDLNETIQYLTNNNMKMSQKDKDNMIFIKND